MSIEIASIGPNNANIQTQYQCQRLLNHSPRTRNIFMDWLNKAASHEQANTLHIFTQEINGKLNSMKTLKENWPKIEHIDNNTFPHDATRAFYVFLTLYGDIIEVIEPQPA